MRRWIRAELPLTLLALVLGAAGGLLVYFGAQLDGALLTAVTGAVFGAAAMTVVRASAKSLTVSEVVVNIPQLSRLTFAVTKDRRDFARRVVNQMASRIALRPLAADEGYPSEAIASLHALFQWLRTTLDTEPGSPPPGKPHADVLAMNLMNLHLAPFLGHWHRRHGDWRAANKNAPESAWPDEAEFRTALADLQPTLRSIAQSFARMAGLDEYAELIGLGPETAPPPPT